MNLPTLVITLLVTILLIIGIKESAKTNAVLVIIKLILVALFLIFGFPHFNPSEHWQNFALNGWHGIMTGAALVFFAYVGFDAVSTTAEEAKNPQRDLPIGMIASLIVCTILYIAVAIVLTGMVPLNILANEHPVAAALNAVGETNVALLISLGITFTMPTVLLVMQLGQVRIFYSMSRDGLLPKKFSQVNPKFNTPVFATITVGIIVSFLAAFMDISSVGCIPNCRNTSIFPQVQPVITQIQPFQGCKVRQFGMHPLRSRTNQHRNIIRFCSCRCWHLDIENTSTRKKTHFQSTCLPNHLRRLHLDLWLLQLLKKF
jgi:APA family basic amino acid/polyamine antiporter